MQYNSSNYPPQQQRSPWTYVLLGCGGCACLSVVVVVAGVFLMGWGLKKGAEEFSKELRKAQVDLKIQDHKLVKKENERYIAGKLKNISPMHTYEMAMVEFDLFDKNGKALKPVSAETKDLKPGAVWEFKVPVTNPAAADYKYREVTGFQDYTEDPNLDPEKRRKMKEQREEMKRKVDEIIQQVKDEEAGHNKP